jgi:HTH-type transcriptional regulator, competence development regulator
VGTPLGDLLQRERRKRDLTLREVERKTGIHNAHLSQIEKGAITRPAPNILFTLAALYDLRYEQLMKLAGHFGGDGRNSNRRAVQGAALHALEELSPKEQREVLNYMKQLVRERQSD